MRLLSSLAGEFVPIGIYALFSNASLQVVRSKKAPEDWRSAKLRGSRRWVRGFTLLLRRRGAPNVKEQGE